MYGNPFFSVYPALVGLCLWLAGCHNAEAMSHDLTDHANVKSLVFDVFGTVVDWRNSVIFELSDFFAEREFEADWPDFVDHTEPLSDRYRRVVDRRCRGDRNHDPRIVARASGW